MSYLGTGDLKKLLPTCIDPFNAANIKQAAYELTLGSEAYLTDSKDGKPAILSDSNPTLDINPGQFALLHTHETVIIPDSKIGFISVKASEKFKGLINVSGFHIDPGFNGKIIYSVYNAGPSIITLRRGEPYFLIFFSELSQGLKTDELYSEKGNHHQFQNKLPTKYIEVLKKSDLASPSALLDRIKLNEKNNEVQFKNLESKKDYNKWLITTLVVLVASITVKVFWDWNSYDRGLADGLSRKMAARDEIVNVAAEYFHDDDFKAKLDSISAVKKRFYDSLEHVFIQKIDSTMAAKIESLSKK